jgi:phospholipid/cholesterol/gamma-HCH transport system ATP-binding protein
MIRIEDVHVRFGDLHVLRGLNLHVKKGDSLVLFGPSGCGKSTVLKLCQGLVKPSSGQVLVNGKDLASMSLRQLDGMRRRTGTLFQYNALFDSMSVEENVGFYLREHRVSNEQTIRGRVNEYLRMVNLEGSNRLRPSELSGGMQKRVGIVRAIIHQPEVVYYDSPTDGLDPVTADLITELILRLNAQVGVTSLAVSNDMATAFKLGGHLAMLHQGRVIETGDREEMLASQNPYVTQFIQGLDEGPITDDHAGWRASSAADAS